MMNRSAKLSKSLSTDSAVIAPEAMTASELPSLTVLYSGENPSVDIVAIHGITGHPFKTFTAGNGVFWLRDLDMLPQSIPNSRILTFNYPAEVLEILGRTSSDTILQHAQTLIAELVADREMDGAAERPIIFVCHSLGGIIVKRALIYSASRTANKIEHLHSIYVSTFGILFLGTPHLGSDKANLARFAQRMVNAFIPSKLVDTSSGLLNTLKVGSEVLQEVTDNFAPLMNRFRIYFFWEQMKSDLKASWDYIVTESSAAPILDNTDRAGLRSDHQNMCKFASKNAPGYKLIASTLRRYCQESPAIISRRWEVEKQALLAMRKHEASELYFAV